MGTSVEPEYPSSPAVELEDNSSGQAAAGSPFWTLLGYVLLPVVLGYALLRSLIRLFVGLVRRPIFVLAAGLLVFSLLASGAIAAGDFIGPAGEPIDETSRDIGDRLTGIIANATDEQNSSTSDGKIRTSEPAAGTTSASSTGLDRETVERQVHAEINRIRTNRSRQTLEFDTDLQQVARGHSQAMAEAGYIYHSGPDGDLQDRLARAGYECRVAISGSRYATGGENVAKTWYRQPIIGGSYHDTPEEVAQGLVQQWMASTGHRENILRDYWQNEGIGIAVVEEDGDTAVYATQVFC